MPQTPEMDGKVPCFPVLLYTSAVPPVSIEITVSEVEYFTNDVESKMEDQVETCNPGHCVWDGQSQMFVDE